MTHRAVFVDVAAVVLLERCLVSLWGPLLLLLDLERGLLELGLQCEARVTAGSEKKQAHRAASTSREASLVLSSAIVSVCMTDTWARWQCHDTMGVRHDMTVWRCRYLGGELADGAFRVGDREVHRVQLPDRHREIGTSISRPSRLDRRVDPPASSLPSSLDHTRSTRPHSRDLLSSTFF